MSDFDFNFDDVLEVHATHLNIPFESNKENSSSCSVQLTNKTDLLVAYRVSSSFNSIHSFVDRVVVSGDEDTYVGTIHPESTCFVTVNGLKQSRISSLYISAFPVKDGVNAEDITKHNLDSKTFLSRGFFELPVVYYKLPAAADSCSAAVAEQNEKKSLLNDDDNNVGSDSSVKRRLSNKISSIVLFSDQEIKAATNCLSDSSKIGQEGYGAVYKCILHGTEVAIKMLDPNSEQGIDEFLQEMEVLGRMRHPNLVKLIGACIQLRALIYEFLPHESLGDCLQKNPEILTWQIRTRIVYEICSALTFLHSIKPQPVVHGDLKPANILLGANFSSKLADFGLCRFIPEGSTALAFLETMPKDTFGYIDPIFMRTGIVTTDCDLYSFGVTILRLLTGIDAIGIGAKVRIAYKGGSLMTIVDSTAGQWPVEVSEFLAYFGLKCCAKRKSPKFLKEIAEDLEEILAEIGVDDLSTNNKLMMVGSVDPLKIPEYVGSKTEKKVDLMSQQPTKKDEESMKAQSDSKDHWPVLSLSDINIHDGLTVHPTVLNIPFELDKESSCNFQLTNKMDRIVAYQVRPSGGIILLAPDDPYKYVGAILPRSTSTVTVTVKLTPEPVDGKERINIWACVIKDGVKAEDITKENLYGLTVARHESFTLPLVCYYTVPAANSSSTVPEENEKGSLLDDNNMTASRISSPPTTG